MKKAFFIVKRQWFDMIKSGEKKEEYREITEYWVRRLICFHDEMEASEIDEFTCDLKNLNTPQKRHNDLVELFAYFNASFKEFSSVTFSNGYNTDNRLDFPFIGIGIATGKTEWGAEPEKYYFVISF
jgi:hypothetical protein